MGNSKPLRFGNSVSDALGPYVGVLRQRMSRVRVVSQAGFSIDPAPGQDVFARTRDACLKWLADRAGRPLPADAWAGRSFELEELGAQRVGAVALDLPVFWSARLDDADRVVAQRTWVTEIGIGKNTVGNVLFGTRLTCVSRGPEEPFERSVPGFVRAVIERGGARIDGRLLGKQPWLVDTAADVEDLVALITNSSRMADVIVVSLPEGSRNPQDALISVAELHRLTLGVAHVVVLSGPGSYHLSDALGKEFSVFHQGVRTYLRQFDPDRDEPFRHPLGVAARIVGPGDGGVEAYFSLLVDKALSNSTTVPNRENRLPPHAELRRIAARRSIERAQKAGGTEKELLELALAENHELTEQIEDQKSRYDELLAMADSDLESEKEASKQQAARNYSLRLRIDALEAKLHELHGAEDEVPLPDSLEDFPAWCAKYLSGTVELLNRAFKGVKSSNYDDPSFLYQALLLIRNYYVPMRREPGAQRKLEYERQLAALGLEESGTIAKERAGEQGDTYVVIVDGRPRMLDRHLKKGSSKDQRHCFRLYFLWEEDSQQVIVGWLPSHLDTRQT